MFPTGAFVNVAKPGGVTSRAVVTHLVRLVQTVKRSEALPVGHTGTLDPLAEGVLPVALGGATRLISYLPARKRYRATVRFGVGTDSDDADGQVVRTGDASLLTPDQVVAAIDACVLRRWVREEAAGAREWGEECVQTFHRLHLAAAADFLRGAHRRRARVYACALRQGMWVWAVRGCGGRRTGAFEPLWGGVEGVGGVEGGGCGMECGDGRGWCGGGLVWVRWRGVVGGCGLRVQLRLEDMPEKSVVIHSCRALRWRDARGGEEALVRAEEDLSLPEWMPADGVCRGDDSEPLHGSTTRDVVLDIECSPGTYIRSLARDLGDRVGVPATIVRLVRVASDGFDLRDSVPVDRLRRLADVLDAAEPPDAPFLRNGTPRAFVIGATDRAVGGGPPGDMPLSARSKYPMAIPDPGVLAANGSAQWSHEPRMPIGRASVAFAEVDRLLRQRVNVDDTRVPCILALQEQRPSETQNPGSTSLSSSSSSSSPDSPPSSSQDSTFSAASPPSSSDSTLPPESPESLVCVYASLVGWSPLLYKEREARSITREGLRSMAVGTARAHEDVMSKNGGRLPGLTAAMRAARLATGAVLSRLLPPNEPGVTGDHEDHDILLADDNEGAGGGEGDASVTPEQVAASAESAASALSAASVPPAFTRADAWSGFARMAPIQTGFVGLAKRVPVPDAEHPAVQQQVQHLQAAKVLLQNAQSLGPAERASGSLKAATFGPLQASFQARVHPVTPDADRLARVVALEPLVLSNPAVGTYRGDAVNLWASLLRERYVRPREKHALAAGAAAAQAVLNATHKQADK